MILTEEGFITMENGAPLYHYYTKDYQGNNRMVVKADDHMDGRAEQYNHYYPFGGVFETDNNSSTQPFKYNGKELDRMFGLNWYDYSARMMDPTLGRFNSIDPMAEKSPNVSPYAYCMGNPMKYVDPDGQDWIVANGSYNYEWRDDITAESKIPEGYQYVGANNSDILNHMGLSHFLPTQKTNTMGMVAADAEQGSYAASHWINVKETSNVVVDANTSFDKDNVTENNSMGRTFNGISVKVLETSTNSGAEGKVITGAEAKLQYGNNIYATNLKQPEDPQVMPQGSTVSQATINISKSQLVYGTTPSSLQVRGNWFVSTSRGMTPIVIPVVGQVLPVSMSFNHKWTFK
jgi:RHS repeat-associated protein